MRHVHLVDYGKGSDEPYDRFTAALFSVYTDQVRPGTACTGPALPHLAPGQPLYVNGQDSMALGDESHGLRGKLDGAIPHALPPGGGQQAHETVPHRPRDAQAWRDCTAAIARSSPTEE